MKSETKLLQSLGFMVIAIILGIYAAYIFSVLWAWFIVPLGVVAIGVGHAYGIMLVKSFLFYKAEENTENQGFKLFLSFITVTIFFGMGYIIHTFFM